MAVEIIVPVSLFLAIFGIIYLYFSTRNKERLALIEKGADASIFANSAKSSSWKVLTLNTALLLIGIGLAIFIGAVLENMGLDEDVAYPGSIFIMAGIGLLVGFFLNKKMEKVE